MPVLKMMHTPHPNEPPLADPARRRRQLRMAPKLAKQDHDGPVGVQPDAVRVGKDVIELVTSGMYVFPVTIYREYIQNAADAIDAARSEELIGITERGRVAIEIDH